MVLRYEFLPYSMKTQVMKQVCFLAAGGHSNPRRQAGHLFKCAHTKFYTFD